MVLSARGLTKIYEGRAVVDDVSFELQPGMVTAFLGPNGAGKSTTLRMLTGLTPPTQGDSWLAGRRYQDWPNPAYVAGVLLDASATHPGRTGAAHLRNAAMLIGVPPRRADQVLDRVGLADAAGTRIGKYSLGMRQRLGLAHALLASPPILILDEPINGLDPVGIRAIRELLRGHAAQGGTVLLSSHVLSEVNQTADRILVIGHGRILADGPLRDLLAPNSCVVRGPDMSPLADLLRRTGIQVAPGSDGQILAGAPAKRVAEIAFRANLRVHSIADQQQDLEELFFRLSADNQR